MSDINKLQDYLDFANRNGLFDGYQSGGGGFGYQGESFQPTIFNTKKMAADWAAQMMQQQGQGRSQMPDYFGAAASSGPPPGATIGPNPYGPRVQALQARQPDPAVSNYLARFLK